MRSFKARVLARLDGRYAAQGDVASLTARIDRLASSSTRNKQRIRAVDGRVRELAQTLTDHTSDADRSEDLRAEVQELAAALTLLRREVESLVQGTSRSR